MNEIVIASAGCIILRFKPQESAQFAVIFSNDVSWRSKYRNERRNNEQNSFRLHRDHRTMPISEASLRIPTAP
jgi:hypothetical protein